MYRGDKVNIIMIGPDTVVKGGISSIIKALKESTLTDTHSIRFLSSYIDYDSRLKKLFKGMGSYFEFVKEINRERPDLVHIHTSFGASFYRKAVLFLLCKIYGLRFINHIHGAEFDKFYHQANFLKRLIVKQIYNLANATIVLSKSWGEDIEGIVDAERIAVLNNFAVIDHAQTDYRVRNNNVIFMGEVGKRKGAYDLPEIIKNVIDEVPEAFFYICGNGEVEKIQNKIEEKGLKNNVHLTGWISGEDKKKLLNDSRVFLLPTYNEGQPMAIIEAMAYKLPVVSTMAGGIPELVQLGVNGYLEHPGDVEKISRHIIKLLKNKALAEKISRNNYNLIKGKYSLEYYLGNLNLIYSSVKPTSAEPKKSFIEKSNSIS